MLSYLCLVEIFCKHFGTDTGGCGDQVVHNDKTRRPAQENKENSK